MHPFRRSLVLCLLLLCAALSSPGQEPSLFMSKEDFAARLRIAQREPWAKDDLATLIRAAENFPQSYTDRYGLSEALVPPEGGQWLHWYACPDSGRHLEFHPPDQNICPDTGKNFSGYPYDHVVYQLRNDDLAEAVVTEALAYRFTSRIEFATKAANVLKQYSKVYPTYALHDNNGKPGINGAKAYSQTLDESIWLIKLAWTYDLIRGTDVLTAAEKQDFEQNVLRASAEVVRKAHKEPTYNIQSWINGAIGAVGYTLNDSALVTEAIDGPIGFRHQMQAFVHEGFWLEGAWGYQFYAMRPLTMLAQMASRKGVNLWKEEPSLVGLFHSPLGVLLPNGRLPAFNDSGSPNLYEQAYLYEVAYAATKDPELLTVLQHGPRSDREAFLFGVDQLPSAPPFRPKSQVFPEAGFATLRSSTTDLTAIMKFGPHGGGHGHYDKLTFILFSQGTTLAIDPGTQLYGLPIHREWDAMTIAHNTISVDGQRQAQSTGKLLSWHAEDGWAAVRADAGPAYPQADLQRTMLLTPEYVVILDHCASSDGKPHTFDWAYHNAGTETLPSLAALAPWTGNPNANGYGHLLNVQSGETANEIDVRFVADPAQSKQDNEGKIAVASSEPGSSRGSKGAVQRREIELNMSVLPAPATQVLAGQAPGPDLKINVPFVIVRRSGISATFASILATSPRPPASAADAIRLKQIDDSHYLIEGPNFSDTFTNGGQFEYRRQPR